MDLAEEAPEYEGDVRARGESSHTPRQRTVSALAICLPSAVILFIAAACFLGPLAYPLASPVGGNVLDANLPLLSPDHVLGTDTIGNDNLSRLLHGGRNSLQIALAVNLIGLLIGGLGGAFAGYRGGIVDAFVMRAFDVLIAFPALVLVLTVAQLFGPGRLNTICALAFVSVPAFARVARAATLRLRDQSFMIAAVLAGSGTCRILVRHLTPNIFPQLAAFGSLGMGVVIGIEGGLSYLGLGARPPEPTWGNMIFQGQQLLVTRPALVVLPASVIFVTILSFNLVGEALRSRWSRL